MVCLHICFFWCPRKFVFCYILLILFVCLFVLVLVCFERRFMQSRLASNSPCSQEWPWTSNLSASISQVPTWQPRTTTHRFMWCWGLGTQGFEPARQALCQLNCISSHCFCDLSIPFFCISISYLPTYDSSRARVLSSVMAFFCLFFALLSHFLFRSQFYEWRTSVKGPTVQ